MEKGRRCYGDGGIRAGVCWSRSASLLSASPRGGLAIWARSRAAFRIQYMVSRMLVLEKEGDAGSEPCFPRCTSRTREDTGPSVPPVIDCRSWLLVLGASTRTRPYRPASWAVLNGGASVRGPPHRLAGVCWLRGAPSLSASPRGGAVMRGGASICGPPHRLAGVCWPWSAPLLSTSPRGGPAIRPRFRVAWGVYMASRRLVRSRSSLRRSSVV